MHSESQIERALELDGASGEFVMDESGYERFVPSDAELEDINRWVATEHDLAETEYASIYSEMAEDMEVYQASKSADIINGEQAIIPAPLAKTVVNQLVATTYNTILRAKPIFSFQPFFNDQYDVVVPPSDEQMAEMEQMAMMQQAQMPMEMGEMPMDGMVVMDEMDDQMPMMGQMGQGPMGMPPPGMAGTVVKRSAEETAAWIEAGYDYKVDSLGFSEKLRTVLTDMAVVKRAWMKVCRETSEYPVIEVKLGGAIIDLSKKREKYIRSKEQVHWYAISGFNMLKRVHEDDIDEADWISERIPCSSDEFYGECLEGNYPLIYSKADTATAQAMSKVVGDPKPDSQKRVEGSTQNKGSATPPNRVDRRLVWFYRHLKFQDADGRLKIKRVSLMGDYHHGARKMCNIFRNPYDHQLRPYALGYQLKDPHSDSGSSSTSDSKWFQKVCTHLVHAEIKNIFLANNFTPWYDENGPSVEQIQAGMSLSPGKAVNGVFNKDWGVAATGANHDSMVPLVGFLKNWHREVVNMSGIESGDTLPGRTPSSTLSQFIAQGSQQTLMFLRSVDAFFRRVVMLDMETRRQYEPLGETLPTRHKESKAIINVPFQFPLGEVAKNFRISLTAADDAAAREHEPEQLMMLLNLWQQYTQFVASFLGPMKEATDSEREFFKKVNSGGQALVEKILKLTRTDTDAFDLVGPIAAIEAEIQALQEAALAEQERLAQEAAMNGGVVDPNQVTNGQGVQPGYENANVGGDPGMVGEPSVAPDLGPPPQGGFPQPEVVQ